MHEHNYYMFHGRRPKRVQNKNIHYPETLIKLGKAIAIEYQSNKKHGGGDGKNVVYRHEFEKTAYLYMDEKCSKQLYIIGSQIKVTESGIEN